jgi:predicted neuraminidase
LYDTYQAVSGKDQKPFGDMVNTMADSFKTKTNTDVPDVNGLIKAQIEQQQTSQQELVTKLSTAMTTAPTQAPNNDGTTEMVAMLSDKLNTMIDKLDSSNDTQAKILQEARS